MIKKIACCAILGFFASSICVYAPQAAANAQEFGSKLTAMPTIITEITASSQFSDYCQNGGSGDALLFYVNDDLSVQLKSGELTVSDITAHKKSGESNTEFLPIFYVKTETTATQLAQYVNDNLSDCMVASDNPILVKSMRNLAKKVSGLVDFRGKDVLTVKEIRDTANKNLAKTVMLGANNTHEDKVLELQKLLMTVWVYDSGEDVDRYRAVSSGANGVFTANILKIEELINSFNEETLIRAPLTVGHRGIPAFMPENTLEGAIEAVKNGANAIESDIYLSADNKLVISHDANIKRTTNYEGNKSINEMTLAEIKSAEIRGRKGEILRVPTLDEYFAEFKGTGIVQVIEIKDNNLEVIKYLAALVKNSKMSDQVVFISFNTAHLNKCLESMPEISVADLNNIPIDGSDYQTAVVAMEALNARHAACNANRSQLNAERVKYLQDRGIPCIAWTYTESSSLIDAFLGGYSGLTADNANDLSAFSNNIKVDDEIKLFSGAENDSPFITVTHGGENLIPTDGELVYLSGDNLGLEYSNGKVSADSNGTGVYYFKTKYSIPRITNYWLYSKPISVTTTDAPPPAGKKGCGGRIVFSGSTLLGGLLGLSLFTFKRRKKVYFF